MSLGIFSRVPPTEPCALRLTQPLKVSTRDFSWGKGSQCVWLTTYHPCSAEMSRKSGALTYPESLGPPRPVAGDLYFICTFFLFVLCLLLYPSCLAAYPFKDLLLHTRTVGKLLEINFIFIMIYMTNNCINRYINLLNYKHNLQIYIILTCEHFIFVN